MLALVCAVSWFVLPGFGVIDLSVTWSADWPQVLEAGWGLFATVIVGGAFVLVGARPRAFAGPGIQLATATAALAVSTVLAHEGPLLLLTGFLSLQTVIVLGLLRRTRPARAVLWAMRPAGISRPMLVVAGAGLLPWLSYALHMWALNRQARSDSDLTLGIDHYSVQGALALSLGLLPLLAALRMDARPFVPVCAGVSAFYLGVVSLRWPDSPGGLSRAGAAAAIVWALAVLAVALMGRGRAVAALPSGRAADVEVGNECP